MSVTPHARYRTRKSFAERGQLAAGLRLQNAILGNPQKTILGLFTATFGAHLFGRLKNRGRFGGDRAGPGSQAIYGHRRAVNE
jgi:hypothetical protein